MVAGNIHLQRVRQVHPAAILSVSVDKGRAAGGQEAFCISCRQGDCFSRPAIIGEILIGTLFIKGLSLSFLGKQKLLHCLGGDPRYRQVVSLFKGLYSLGNALGIAVIPFFKGVQVP